MSVMMMMRMMSSYEHNEHKKAAKSSAFILRVYYLSAPAEATSFCCSPESRTQMIPRASIKLQHKRIDDCETEAVMKLGFIFSSPQRLLTPKLAVMFTGSLLQEQE